METRFPLALGGLPAAVGLATLTVVAALAACGGSNGGEGSDPPTDDAGTDSAPPDAPPIHAEYGLDTRAANPTCLAPGRPPNTAKVTFQQVFANAKLAAPLMMTQIPGDGSRWYVAERGGAIRWFSTTAPADTPATAATIPNLDLRGEGGLLGLAFHPQFAQNGRLYVSFTSTGGPNGVMRSRVGYLTSTDGGQTFGNYADVLTFDQTDATNHKGGAIAFGKDGLLYLGFGDGGGGGDTYGHGQLTTTFFAKILRIDVDNVPPGQTYGIPDGNPFKNGGGEPAAYAWGMRNPFRFSFDRLTGDLWVGDVGQDAWEEVDVLKAPGGNYGWPCTEGTHDYPTTPVKCPSRVGLIGPVFEYSHNGGSAAIIGGVVYHGKAIPDFEGTYVFGDEVTKALFSLRFDPATGASVSEQLNASGSPANAWVDFAEDVDGEVYALGIEGKIYKLVPTPGSQIVSTFPDKLSKTGCVDPTNPKMLAGGVIPYSVNAALWSDGAQKERAFALPDGTRIGVSADGDLDFPIGTVAMKTFMLEGKRVETRLLVRHDDGGWAGYSYEWDDAESDATLLATGKAKTVGPHRWYYPSRSECLRCHTESAGRTLGLELGQLNGDFTYASTNRISNQLKTLDHLGLFAAPLAGPV